MYNRSVPNVTIRAVDLIWEAIQRGFDAPSKREPQSLLGLVRLLGELYNYSALSSQVVFDMMYYAINYGHETPLMLASTRLSHPLLTPSTAESISNSAKGGGGVPETPIKVQSPSMLTSTLLHDPRIASEVDLDTDFFRTQVTNTTHIHIYICASYVYIVACLYI